MGKQVFISYKAEESKMAEKIKNEIETAGFSCWMAPSSIPGGSSYAAEIETAIRDCKIFVLILSKSAMSSKWVEKELDRALTQDKIILALKTADFELSPSFSYYLTNVQLYEAYIDYDRALNQFIGRIKDEIKPDSILDTKENRRVNEEKPVVKQLDLFAMLARQPAPPVPKTVKKSTTSAGLINKKNITSTNRNANKNKKTKTYLILAVFVILLSIFIILLIELNDSEFSGNQQGFDEKNIEMSDNIYDFTFELNGIVYKLPMSFQTLSEDGWTIASKGYSNDMKIPGESDEQFDMIKDGKMITVYSYNASGDTKMLKDCRVGGVEVDIKSGNDFKIAKGISCTSSAEEIVAAFGTPSQRNDYNERFSIIYSNADYNKIAFSCYKKDSNMWNYSSLLIKNYTVMDDDLNNLSYEINNEVPEYLSEYKKPSALGDDLASGIVLIAGDLYQLPAPLSQFLNNGWKISSYPGAIVSGKTDSATIVKNDTKLYIKLANLAEYQTIPENCIVYYLSFDNTMNGLVTLPNDIKIGITKAELESKIGSEFSVYEGSYSYAYTYEGEKDSTINLTIRVDIQTKLVKEISISNKTWPFRQS